MRGEHPDLIAVEVQRMQIAGHRAPILVDDIKGHLDPAIVQRAVADSLPGDASVAEMPNQTASRLATRMPIAPMIHHLRCSGRESYPHGMRG